MSNRHIHNRGTSQQATYKINLSKSGGKTILPPNLSSNSRNNDDFTHKTILLNAQNPMLETGRQSTWSKMATIIKPGVKNSSISQGSTITTSQNKPRLYGKNSDFIVDNSKYAVTNTTLLKLKRPDSETFIDISIKRRKNPIMSMPENLASKAQIQM